MFQESMVLKNASIFLLQQFAAILGDFLQQMLHVAHDPPISRYFWPRNRDGVVERHPCEFPLSSGGM